MAIFTGSGVAIITPFTSEGAVNYIKLREILEEQIKGKTDSIIICGTTGESSTMTHEEHIEAIRFTCEVVNKRIPVIAGTGSNSTQEAISLSQEAEKVGADGLLLVTPYYNKATQKGLIEHYKLIANSVNIPIILYHIPGRTGVTMSPKTIVTLCKEVPNIIGIKEASGNIGAIAEMMYLAEGCVDLYSGNDDQIVPLLSLGGKGVISVIANIAPEQTHDMCQAFFDGDVTKSTKMQLEAMGLIKALFNEVNPIPVKAAMNLMGKEVGGLRLPLTEIEEDNKKILEDEMKKYGIL